MNYLNLYYNIIEKSKYRNLKRERGYCIHHIIPSIYFKNRKISTYDDNMVKLTHKEHYVCHHLLSKSGCPKMIYAFWLMSHINKNLYRLSAKEFEILVNKHSNNVSKQFKNRVLSDEHKLKIGKSNKGNKSKFKGIPHSNDENIKTSNAIKEWWNIRKANGYKGMSEEGKQKMRNRIPWNKGLTKADKRVAKVWETRKANHIV